MIGTRSSRRRAVVAIVSVAALASVVALTSACGRTPVPPPAAPEPPTSTTMPLGPRSTATVDVSGPTALATVDVATLSISDAGGLAFQEFRTVPSPVHQRFAFTPPPGAQSMGVVVRSTSSEAGQMLDCTLTVDGVVVEREEHVYGCTYSSDPRWSYLLIKGVIPGRFWPPTG